MLNVSARVQAVLVGVEAAVCSHASVAGNQRVVRL